MSETEPYNLHWDTALRKGEEGPTIRMIVFADKQKRCGGYDLLDLWVGRVSRSRAKRQIGGARRTVTPEQVLSEDQRPAVKAHFRSSRRDTKRPLRAIKVDRDKKRRAQQSPG